MLLLIPRYTQKNHQFPKGTFLKSKQEAFGEEGEGVSLHLSLVMRTSLLLQQFVEPREMFLLYLRSIDAGISKVYLWIT